MLELAVEALEAPVDPALPKKERDRRRRRQLGVAHAYARAIDWTAMEWFWIEAGHEWQRRHDPAIHLAYGGDRANPNVPVAMKREVASRDGFRCRYCGIRVVTSATLTKLEQLLPAALPLWPAEMGPAEITAHAAQCVLRLTWDHVEPRSACGRNDPTNIVSACGTCNFNKGSCTLEELSLRNPFDRDPHPDGAWVGLNGRLGSRGV